MIGYGLAVRQLWRAPARGLLAVLLLVATLTPLLLVWSLKAGQVDPLIEGVRSDPTNLEISLHNDQVLSEGQLATLRGLPGMGYFEPTTRGLSVRAYLSGDANRAGAPVGLLPSSAGDPLLGGADGPALDQAVLSAEALRQVAVAVGDRVWLTSSHNNGTAPFVAELVVVGSLEPSRLSGAKLLVNPQLAFELESFLNNYAVPRLGVPGNEPATLPSPSNARVYADRLESVVPLERALEQAGFFASIANGGVELAQTLDHAAQLLVLCIGSALVAGAAAAQWVGMALCFIPQRRQVALLRLMGAGPDTVFAYVLTLGVGIAAGGLALSIAAFLALSTWLNGAAPLSGGVAGTSLSHLGPGELVSFAGGSMVLAASVSIVFALIFGAVQPSGALRDEMS